MKSTKAFRNMFRCCFVLLWLVWENVPKVTFKIVLPKKKLFTSPSVKLACLPQEVDKQVLDCKALFRTNH